MISECIPITDRDRDDLVIEVGVIDLGKAVLHGHQLIYLIKTPLINPASQSKF
jgi:hypothetical protein